MVHSGYPHDVLPIISLFGLVMDTKHGLQGKSIFHNRGAHYFTEYTPNVPRARVLPRSQSFPKSVLPTPCSKSARAIDAKPIAMERSASYRKFQTEGDVS